MPIVNDITKLHMVEDGSSGIKNTASKVSAEKFDHSIPIVDTSSFSK